jgi:hypothetical protein
MLSGASREQVQPPVRGTQSFVGVMGAVRRRASLTALEILWRWAAGVPILTLAYWEMLRLSRTVHVDTAALESMSVFQPVAAFHVLELTWAAILPAVRPFALWAIPLCIVVWLLFAAWGRTLVLRRYDHELHPRPLTSFTLGALRSALLMVVWMIWIGLIRQAGRIAIIGPAAAGSEPDVVLYCAILICGSLVLYVLWAICSWPFQLTPLLAMAENIGPWPALLAAWRSNAVRGKLIEINLVMHIVRIALLVLAMVFSASPLPFSSVETQTFLECWSAGVIVLYLVVSDYFHVVRSAAYLSLWRELGAAPETSAPGDSKIVTAERFTL